jgi:hypothetical protein
VRNDELPGERKEEAIELRLSRSQGRTTLGIVVHLLTSEIMIILRISEVHDTRIDVTIVLEKGYNFVRRSLPES